jgi:hypothetical protein
MIISITNSLLLKMLSNQNLYISFIGENFGEQNVLQIFEDKQIGEIEKIVFFDHNYQMGPDGTWGRAAIIYMKKWEFNDYTRALNFMMNTDNTTFIKIDESISWAVQKYSPSLSNDYLEG